MPVRYPPFARSLVSVSIAVLWLPVLASASDWPAYRHDARRSAVSTDTLAFPLNAVWKTTSKLPPQPAFADPLKHPTGVDFAYIRDHSEPVLLDFDHAYHPVIANERVFFGSSADDTVRCVSLTSGEQLWVYVTGGPVRFAPQVVDDRIYVASDDGFIYCLTADNGDVVWKTRAAPSERQLVGNGRMISRWPLRSGALVVDGSVHVTAGMWPAEGIFVYSLNAETGAVQWVNDTSGTLNQRTANPGAYAITGVAPTGYLLSDRGALVVPTGRSIPASYSLSDGRLLASVPPSYQNRRGGPAVCIDPHGSVIFGYPRERLTGTTYSLHYAYNLPKMVQYGTMRADRVVIDDKAFVATNDLIRCYEANSRYTKVKVPWQHACPSKPLRCLSLAANALLLGIDDRVVARDRTTGDVLWQHEGLDGYVQSIAVADEQLLVATDTGSIYCFATATNESRTGLPARPEPVGTRPTGLETRPTTATLETHPALREALRKGRTHRGLALVIGYRDTQLAAQLAAGSQLQVVLLLDDADAVTQARRELLEQRDTAHGQVSVQQLPEANALPFADYAFNVIAATPEMAAGRAKELHRVLRPAGGILYVDHPTADDAKPTREVLQPLALRTLVSGQIPNLATMDVISLRDTALIYRRGKLDGALDWDSENKTDQLVKWPLELLWFGGPGSKRTGGGSKPPVAAGGRNLVVGKNHLIALDAYNGTELWSRTLPYLYRNIGRLRKGPGPINPWLTRSINADDDHVWLNFGHVVYTLDAATGVQQAVHGEFPDAPQFSLDDGLTFQVDHYQKSNIASTAGTRTKAEESAGSIQLREDSNGRLQVTLDLDPKVEIAETVYWELFFDTRRPEDRRNLYEPGVFQLLVWPATGRVDTGLGPIHPAYSVVMEEAGRRMVVSLPGGGLAGLSDESPETHNGFCFAAALNHLAGPEQTALAAGRGYLRWEVHADSFAYAFNNGWARITRGTAASTALPDLPAITDLPERALRSSRIGFVGKKAGYVVNVSLERENPLSLEISDFDYNRGKGCGNPVSADGLQVLRSGTLAFYDLNDDSGMRYFGGVRPSCTISAVPAQGLVFAAEGSSGCSCNYNFKTTLALAPARQRRHEDWAMYTAPLSPGALLQTGRFNLGAPGDRRDELGGLWLQYPRAPTYASRIIPNTSRSMLVPVELLGSELRPYRVNADRVAIANTDRPWLYASGHEGIAGVRLQLFMSDKDGIVVFPGEAPTLDAVLEQGAWERRYAVPAGTGSSLLLAHDSKALHVGYEIVPPLDRRGTRLPWTIKEGRELPHTARFDVDDKADDAEVWLEDSLEFLISDTSLQTILHFGFGVSGGRYDGAWSAKSKKEDAAYTATWSAAIDVAADKAVAEITLPWKTLTDAGLDLQNLVIRPRTKKPLTRQPHISHGFRPVLVQANQPEKKLFRVVLHFAELSPVAVGDRVFDIQIQGQTVQKAYDPVAAAGGRNRATVLVYENIEAKRALDIRFVSPDQQSREILPPILSAVEVLLQK